ncbi:hypothetical protein [Streptomyces sp. NPDC047042]
MPPALRKRPDYLACAAASSSSATSYPEENTTSASAIRRSAFPYGSGR